MNARFKAILIGVLLATTVFVTVRATSQITIDRRFSVCASCGTGQEVTSILSIPINSKESETDQSRWMLSLSTRRHSHSWVFTQAIAEGWHEISRGCARPEEAWELLMLESAHDVLGNDPILADLVRDFVALPQEAVDERLALVDRATNLRVAVSGER